MKITTIALALCLGFAPFTSTIGAPQTIALKFQTVLTKTDFLIKARDTLPTETDVTSFKYDDIRHTFSSYENEFGITSTGKVTAKLQKIAELVDSKKKISVEVTLGTKVLTTTPTDVHPGDPAEKKYAFTVKPKDGTYEDGTYKGDVVLVFDVG